MRELPSPLWSYSPVCSLIWPTFYERAPLSSLVTQSSELSDLTHVVLRESSLHLPGYRLWWVLWSDLSCSEIVPLCSLDTQFSELSNLTYVGLRKFPSTPWEHNLVRSPIWPTLFWESYPHLPGHKDWWVLWSDLRCSEGAVWWRAVTLWAGMGVLKFVSMDFGTPSPNVEQRSIGNIGNIYTQKMCSPRMKIKHCLPTQRTPLEKRRL